MRAIIGITGKAGSGKDTVALMINKLLGNKYHVRRYSGKLKEVASILLGVPVEKFEDQEYKKSTLGGEWNNITVREFLQTLGTDCVRYGLHDDAWVIALWNDYKEERIDYKAELTDNGFMFQGVKVPYQTVTKNEYAFPNWLIPDVRFNNEADAITDRRGLIIKVQRPGIKTMDHASENELETIIPHYTIINDGSFFDLEHKTKRMINYLEEHFK